MQTNSLEIEDITKSKNRMKKVLDNINNNFKMKQLNSK